ncbi:MAG: zinc-dependent alcohol dehydrogenase family protein [Chloroflexota bacterium]|nr:zinc-dependent alcohol dehydrogenase family protein [Chloroflexota bacterium]
MVLGSAGTPLAPRELAEPRPGPGEILIAVSACGVCRTDLHIRDGELPRPSLPLVPGHQVVGRVVARGDEARRFAPGVRVGVPWLGGTDGSCAYCRGGRENLCPGAVFTGYTRDGGFAELCTANERFCFPLPDALDDAHSAPLLCAGLIGYRALRLAGDAPRLGLYGYGSSAHLVAQVARDQPRRIFAFTRPGDDAGQRFARDTGCDWAGGSDERPPEPLDAAIVFAPVGALVPAALRALAPGGVVVCAGIRMSDIPSFPYELLWEERHIRSVANLTRRDGEEFLPLAARLGLRPTVEVFPLADAEAALAALRAGRITGSPVLRVS